MKYTKMEKTDEYEVEETEVEKTETEVEKTESDHVLRLYRYRGVVYMIDLDCRVYCYNPEMPIQVGVWNKKTSILEFLPGFYDALCSGQFTELLRVHKNITE